MQLRAGEEAVKCLPVPQSKHDSVIFTLIRHTCMPGPQISQHNIPLVTARLNGRPNLTPSLYHFG